MNSERYRGLISRYVDDAVDAREREELIAHLSECPECASTLARYRQAALLLSRLPASEPAPAVRAAVLGSQGTVASRRVPAAVALAAVLLLAAAMFALPRAALPDFQARPSAVAGPTMQPVAADGGEMVEALTRSLDPASRPALPTYLPRGTTVERVSLGRPGARPGAYEMRLDLRLADGQTLVLRQEQEETRPVAAPSPSRVLVAGGREWRYLPKPGRTPREAPLNVLVSEANGTRVELESSLPLEDLVRVAESLR